MAYDHSMYVRALCAELEAPFGPLPTAGMDAYGNPGAISWKAYCKRIPFCLGTDCKSLYDTCVKPASTTKEKRVALDLLDVREGVGYVKDSIRWVPMDHMSVGCLTKAIHPSLLNRYMHDYLYSFKCDTELHTTKRAAAKERKQQREERLKQGGKKQKPPSPIGEVEHVSLFCSNNSIADDLCSIADLFLATTVGSAMPPRTGSWHHPPSYQQHPHPLSQQRGQQQHQYARSPPLQGPPTSRPWNTPSAPPAQWGPEDCMDDQGLQQARLSANVAPPPPPPVAGCNSRGSVVPAASARVRGLRRQLRTTQAQSHKLPLLLAHHLRWVT